MRSRSRVLATVGAAGLAVGAALALGGGDRRAAPIDQPGWSVIWEDDFDGPGLDADNWAYCHWWDDGGCTIAGNRELQWYLPEGVSVAGGLLTLTAKPADLVAADGTSFSYSSGMVSSGPRDYLGELSVGFTFIHGYVEMQARVPEGAGLWPAFWLLPADRESRPEIDVMEVRGHDTATLAVHFHYDRNGERRSVGRDVRTPDLAADWHRYGLLWQADELVWYLDGTEIWSYDGPGIPREPMYLVANLAVGGGYAGAPDDSTRFPARFEIDYVRVWQETS